MNNQASFLFVRVWHKGKGDTKLNEPWGEELDEGVSIGNPLLEGLFIKNLQTVDDLDGSGSASSKQADSQECGEGVHLSWVGATNQNSSLRCELESRISQIRC